jgi:hypothetical protein
MKLWLLKQFESNGYDTYDSMVVAAETEDDARLIHPSIGWQNKTGWPTVYDDWAKTPDQVKVTLIGEAVDGTEPGAILRSFNAG